MGLCSVCLAENSVENSGIFLLLLGRACAEARAFLLLTLPSEKAGGAQ